MAKNKMKQELDAEIQAIMKKYSKKEEELEKQLRECEIKCKKLQSAINGSNSQNSLHFDYEKAEARNQQLLEDLQKTKAMLMAESIYSPTDQEVEDLLEAYLKDLQISEVDSELTSAEKDQEPSCKSDELKQVQIQPNSSDVAQIRESSATREAVSPNISSRTNKLV